MMNTGVLLILTGGFIVSGDLCENGKDDHCMALDSPSQDVFNQEKDWSSAPSIYPFFAYDGRGQNVSLEQYRGHVLVIINVAGEFSTNDANYQQLVRLREKYGDKLKIVVFASNQIASDIYGESKILKFINNGNIVDKFDLYKSINVNGENAHPLWKWLQIGSKPTADAIQEHFMKFIIDRDGKVVGGFPSSITTDSMEIILRNYFAN